MYLNDVHSTIQLYIALIEFKLQYSYDKITVLSRQKNNSFEQIYYDILCFMLNHRC